MSRCCDSFNSFQQFFQPLLRLPGIERGGCMEPCSGASVSCMCASHCSLSASGRRRHVPWSVHTPSCPAEQIVRPPRRVLILCAGLPPVGRDTPLHFPRMDQKTAAREEHIRAAKEKGINTGARPTGAVS